MAKYLRKHSKEKKMTVDVSMNFNAATAVKTIAKLLVIALAETKMSSDDAAAFAFDCSETTEVLVDIIQKKKETL